jgi:hypothetical protein
MRPAVVEKYKRFSAFTQTLPSCRPDLWPPNSAKENLTGACSGGEQDELLGGGQQRGQTLKPFLNNFEVIAVKSSTRLGHLLLLDLCNACSPPPTPDLPSLIERALSMLYI